MQQNSEHFPLSKDLTSSGTLIIRQLLLMYEKKYIVDYSNQLVSQFLDWANTKLVECHAIQASFQLLLVMTCVKTATAFLSKIPERRESMNLETNQKILTGISFL